MALVWLTDANYKEGFKILLTFNNGISGVVDLKNHLDGKVFEPLKAIDFFKKFELDSWTLTWPNGADYSPEFLYDLVLSQLENEATAKFGHEI